MPLRLTEGQLRELQGGKPVKAHKYGAVRMELDGVQHDSSKEGRRWATLQLMQRAGLITELERQVTYVLAPSVKFEGAARAQPALRIVVDFRYRERGELVLEECKGGDATITPAFVIKRHLLLHVHGLQLRIV
jgi:hypothetical protein